ncbi:MAG TPA: GNAT family N-acetyltransferase [Acidimicrobiales bacterium]|nr:GNAT family N-acetyltransferase [Acidimicrobiales bacterium]
MAGDTLVVRLVRREEAEAAGRLVVAAFEAIPGAHMTGGYAEELFDVAGRSARAEVYVAVEGGDVVGCTTLVTDPHSPLAEEVQEGECQIRMMAVAPSRQGQGIGQRLLDAVLQRVTPGNDFDAVFLHSTPSMSAAHHLYRRNGFVRVPERDWRPVPDLTLIAFRLALPDASG